ncbi:hypothetical protein [Flavobacterium luminosum]|uniref:Uncharacterized protein n=1 Tax=Flavobacterium luminosum TaxID=2949086 RepID=A0ABT0TPN5_9FLAO|nr:hypothetical protein [Flavobacterium sp. HXWNR70]MCL9809453.1 hypothetical protein [Flavobacterium sp. HXWNR70]
MKFKVLTVFLFFFSFAFAQKPCKLALDVKDSIGVFKETKNCLVYEKVFGNSAQLIFLTLASDNDVPYIKLQIIQKSKDFITPKCLETNSKLFFQLSNGKIYTLINANEGSCDKFIYNELDKENNRFLEANYLFLKNDFEDLKKYSISLMKIHFSSGEVDYVLPKEIVSEKVETTSRPEDFFRENFNCIFTPDIAK